MTRPPHHRPDGRFANPAGSPRRAATLPDFLRFLGRQVAQARRAVIVPPGHVLSEDEALARWAALEGGDGILWLGHASFLIRIDGVTILTDPYLGLVAGPRNLGPRRFVQAAIHPARLPPIDVLAVSHDHYDHLCEWTLDQLAPRRHALRVVCPLRVGHHFTRRGFAHVRELDWGEGVTARGAGPGHEVAITALPAIHFSGRGALDRNRSLWASFAFASTDGGPRVFFSGDTGHGPVFREIGRDHGPFDLAIVGIGAYDPRAIMAAVHANPEEGLDIAADVGATVALGMHWGTIVLTEEPPFEPAARFAAAAEARGLGPDRAWILAIGETRALARTYPKN